MMTLLRDPLWQALLPLFIVNAIFFSLFVYFYFARKNIPHDVELQTRHKSKILNLWIREYWMWSTQPFLKFLVKLGATPNSITTAGFIFSVLSALAFANGKMGLGGWMLIIGGTLDVFDGRIARMKNLSTKTGAFYDSVMDRFGEGVVFWGLAWYYQNSWIFHFIIAGLIGSMLVSYTRSQGANSGVICDTGIMQRAERIVYLGVGSALSPVFKLIISGNNINAPEYLTIAAIVLIGVLTNLTAIHRMIFIHRGILALNPQEQKKKDNKSKVLSKLEDSILDSLH